MNRCVFVRVCVLLPLLYLGAYVYVEFKGYYIKNWRTLSPTKDPQKHTQTEEKRGTSDSVPTCDPTGRQFRKSLRWKIELEPWASDSHSLEDEALRFIKHITTPQVSCRNPVNSLADQGSWALCLDKRFHLAQSINTKRCRVYSLGLGGQDKQLERSLAKAGCEVHCFDPSISEAHLQDSNMWLHRLSIDWRDPNPAIMTQRQQSSTKKLSAILNHYGHRQIDVLKVDMESAEWKILENLILEKVLHSVGLLLLEVHLHWAGFEVSGDKPSVVRFWFSLLKELENTHFRLYHSYRDSAKPQLFLQENLHNASSTYILGWVNRCYSPG